ncbi:hypothetical protein HFO49_26055 [Rhizobium leguminosarum]|uniref:hypothetical protein n=1 Tax=Rhizobium leguminosarum TaxID=384 RepID=UPI001C95D14A|nr:hypothetical protein [Rhizobium leguminosarum]MBY5590909.1 hypothetical protein [Rhizobium leguminosarum]
MYRQTIFFSFLTVLAVPAAAQASAFTNLVEFAVTQGIDSGVGPKWETIARNSIPVINEGKLDKYNAKVGFLRFENIPSFTISLENLSKDQCNDLAVHMLTDRIPVALNINGTIVPTWKPQAYSPKLCGQWSSNMVIIAR